MDNNGKFEILCHSHNFYVLNYWSIKLVIIYLEFDVMLNLSVNLYWTFSLFTVQSVRFWELYSHNMAVMEYNTQSYVFN